MKLKTYSVTTFNKTDICAWFFSIIIHICDTILLC